MSFKPSFRSVRLTQPLESMSNILKASNILKSGFWIRPIFAVSSSLSREIYSLNALTNSSSSDSLRTGYFPLDGEDSLIPPDLFIPLKLSRIG